MGTPTVGHAYWSPYADGEWNNIHHGRARDEAAAQEVVGEIEEAGGRAMALAADISNPKEVSALFETIQNRFAYHVEHQSCRMKDLRLFR